MNNSNPIINRNILVIGAGELGIYVLRKLAKVASHKGGANITTLLRPSQLSNSPAKKNTIDELHRLGIDVLEADIINDSLRTLTGYFSRFDIVISCVGFSAGPGIQLKLTHAALEAGGVKRYMPWQFGVDYDVIGKGSPQDLFDEQCDVRQLLRAQEQTDWIILSTGMFTSFLFEPSFGVVDLDNNIIHALGSWDTEVTVTTPEDIGRITAELMFADPPLVNQVVFVAGDTLSYAQLADTVDKTLNCSLDRIEWSVAKLKEDLDANPDDPIKKYRAVFSEGKGVAWPKQHTFNAKQGFHLTTVAEWIEQNINHN